MNKLSCPRCENPFFTAAREPHLPCPYCGFLVKTLEPDRRDQGRTMTQKLCDLLKGEVRVPVKTVDLSDTGVGIKMTGYLPFDKDDTVSILLEDFEIERKAQVIWTKKFYGISRAGLKFCEN